MTYEHSLGARRRSRSRSLQYVLFENGTGYTLTYTTLAWPPSSTPAEFERSAQSFRI